MKVYSVGSSAGHQGLLAFPLGALGVCRNPKFLFIYFFKAKFEEPKHANEKEEKKLKKKKRVL